MTDLPYGEIQIRVKMRRAIGELSDHIRVARDPRAMHVQRVEIADFPIGRRSLLVRDSSANRASPRAARSSPLADTADSASRALKS